MCVMRIFLRLVLIEVVFMSLWKLLKMLAILRRLSSFLVLRIFVLIVLLDDHLACVCCCVAFQYESSK